jgi:hypothetical protein
LHEPQEGEDSTEQRNSSEQLSTEDTLIACENDTWHLIKQGDLTVFAGYLAESARLYSGKGNFDEKFRHIRLGQARQPVVKRLCGCLGAVNCCLATVRANSMIEKPSVKILSRKRKTIYQKNHTVAGTVLLLTISAPRPWVTLART